MAFCFFRTALVKREHSAAHPAWHGAVLQSAISVAAEIAILGWDDVKTLFVQFSPFLIAYYSREVNPSDDVGRTSASRITDKVEQRIELE